MNTTVFQAIRFHDLESLKKILEEDPKAIAIKDEKGIWAAQLAALSGDYDIMKYLVEYSLVSFNLTDDNGNTILHYGVRSGNLELVRYLVERVGMSITAGNWDRKTPFDLSQSYGFLHIEQYFEEKCGCELAEMYRNPILTGMHPDPSIVRVGEDYYMVNSSFVFFPCIPISHSRNLVNWKLIGHAISNPNWAGLDGLEGGRGYWAPDISYYEGRFYITATYRLNDSGKIRRMQMMTSSVHPEGPYSEPVFLNEDGIDPSIFTDLDGRRYMLLNRGARIFQISTDGSEILTKPELLWYGDQKHAPEGPHLIFKDGYYYLFVAEGGTGRGHRISVARSKTLMGPYETCPYNPIMQQHDENGVIQCCGHGKPVQTADGDWYIVYLCSRMLDGKYSILGRETCLDPITWTDDGWPVVNNLSGPSMLQEKPFINNKSLELCAEDEWSADTVNISFPNKGYWGGWCTVRSFLDNFGYEGGDFWMRGCGLDLNDIKCRSILLLSQPSFQYSVECMVYFPQFREGESAGHTCYYDENSFFKFGVGRQGDVDGILVQEYVNDRYVSNYFIQIANIKNVEMKIDTNNLTRICSYRLPGAEWVEAVVLYETAYLSSEGLSKGKRFTGAMAGIYVHGDEIGTFKNFALKRG